MHSSAISSQSCTCYIQYVKSSQHNMPWIRYRIEETGHLGRIRSKLDSVKNLKIVFFLKSRRIINHLSLWGIILIRILIKTYGTIILMFISRHYPIWDVRTSLKDGPGLPYTLWLCAALWIWIWRRKLLAPTDIDLQSLRRSLPLRRLRKQESSSPSSNCQSGPQPYADKVRYRL